MFQVLSVFPCSVQRCITLCSSSILVGLIVSCVVFFFVNNVSLYSCEINILKKKKKMLTHCLIIYHRTLEKLKDNDFYLNQPTFEKARKIIAGFQINIPHSLVRRYH